MQALISVTIFCDRDTSGRFDDWVAHLEAALALGDFDEGRKLQLMRSKLYGEAAEEFDTFKLDNPIRARAYADVKTRVMKLFHSMETRSQRSVEFHNMTREPEENMRRYANRMRKAFHLAYPLKGTLDPTTNASREQMMMDRFIEGLQSELQDPRLKHKEFPSFEKLIDKAELLSMALEEAQTRSRVHAVFAAREGTAPQPDFARVMEALERLNEKVDRKATTHHEELQNSLAQMKKQLTQQVRFSPQQGFTQQPGAFRRAAVFCDFHNTWGSHSEEDCHVKMMMANDRCHLCKNVGHRASYCPTIKNPKPPPPSGTIKTSFFVTNERPSESLQQEFVVVHGIMEECVLGLDALYQHNFVIDGHKKRVYRVRGSDQSNNRRDPVVVIQKKLIVPPFSACIMESGGDGTNFSPGTSFFLTNSPTLPPGLRLDPYVSKSASDTFRIVVA
ncbi:hypothetical protein DAPPUDRAFT_108167 [Daphnia pulex]|uniref:CCHC-type domain-containing protein n=1 Tax=Daphnia pulex TaxID=6669 RepID=E9GZC5_DAPPU|nr:hypothetical protein DAPPUDRAFT_108167 [Daphnia pulex]|eukprot:EFX75126.1 hypothetical protein DAPPUDRAFT_108167 [Daphnia pulex]